MVLVIYGTITKNRWGINTDQVFCPRCNTPLPRIRKPQTLQEALWGGGSCSACGANIDKWGRELVSHEKRSPPGTAQREGNTRKVLQRKLIIFTASSFFCSSLLLDWLEVLPHMGGLTSSLIGWIVLVAYSVVETVIFTALFYFAWTRLLDRFRSKDC
jgi:hypothetical protein